MCLSIAYAGQHPPGRSLPPSIRRRGRRVGGLFSSFSSLGRRAVGRGRPRATRTSLPSLLQKRRPSCHSGTKMHTYSDFFSSSPSSWNYGIVELARVGSKTPQDSQMSDKRYVSHIFNAGFNSNVSLISMHRRTEHQGALLIIFAESARECGRITRANVCQFT